MKDIKRRYESISLGADALLSAALLGALEKGTTEGKVVLLYRAAALEATGGNVSKAARMLGINRRTLYRESLPRSARTSQAE